VAAELGRRGLIATPFAGNVPIFDLLAVDEKGRAIPIQVKTINGPSWSSTCSERGDCPTRILCVSLSCLVPTERTHSTSCASATCRTTSAARTKAENAYETRTRCTVPFGRVTWSPSGTGGRPSSRRWRARSHSSATSLLREDRTVVLIDSGGYSRITRSARPLTFGG
jgi:hypothetical protein